MKLASTFTASTLIYFSGKEGTDCRSKRGSRKAGGGDDITGVVAPPAGSRDATRPVRLFTLCRSKATTYSKSEKQAHAGPWVRSWRLVVLVQGGEP